MTEAWSQRQLAFENLRIFAYDLPACARPALDVLQQMDDDHDRLHLQGMMQQILAVEDHLKKHLVSTPEEADLFWVPAYFPLLFWLEQNQLDATEAWHLFCVQKTVNVIEESPYIFRNAGYDHLLIYGYEYPHWKRLSHLVLDNYSPFLGNAILISVGYWSQGRRSATVNAGLYPLLRIVTVPYFAHWDCHLKEDLLKRPRQVAVAFAGSIKDRPPYFVFRERLLVAGAVERAFKNDSRVLFEVFGATAAERTNFAREYKAHRSQLYSSADFCLAMPGDGNTAGRLFDAMMLGCIPVLLFHPDSYPVLPFVSRIPWHDFAVVASMASEEQAGAILQGLLDMPLAERQERRQRTLRYAPLVALSLQNCPSEVVSALDLISMELQDKVAMLRTAVLPGMQTATAPRSRDDWLLWGPSRPS